ncbi:hypothetical protein IEE94_03130 [Yimella sp. cx-573]|nr:hypothetical protein [Yimella sp. cx-573]
MLAVGASAPVLAGSTPPPPSLYGNICEIFYGTGGVNAQRMQVSLGMCRDSTPFATGSITGNYYLYTFTFDQPVPKPTISSGTWFGSDIQQSADQKTLTVKVWFKTVPTAGANSCYCGSIALQWDGSASSLSAQITPEVTVSVATSDNGGSTVGSLSWKVPRRCGSATVQNLPHYFVSKSGVQSAIRQ